MKAYVAYCATMVLGIITVLALLDAQESRRDAGQWQDSARVRGEQVTIWKARYAEEASVVRTNTVQVVKWATRYDTIRAEADSFITDTVIKTVPADWVRQLVTVSDSTIAACRDLVSSCERFRTTADSTISAVSLERDLYQNLYKSVKPSRWDHVKPFVFGAAGLYVGLKLRAP